MSFFSKQAFDDDDDSDIDCELADDNNNNDSDNDWLVKLNNNNNTNNNNNNSIINTSVIPNQPQQIKQEQKPISLQSINPNRSWHAMNSNNSLSINPIQCEQEHVTNIKVEEDEDSDLFNSDSDSDGDKPIISNINYDNNKPIISTQQSSSTILAPSIPVQSPQQQKPKKLQIKLPTKHPKQKQKQTQNESTTNNNNNNNNNNNKNKQEAMQYVIPSNQHLKLQNKNKHKTNKYHRQNKKYKSYGHNHKVFGYQNTRNDWKRKAGIVSTKVNNKQCPIAHPKSDLNIQQRAKYNTLRRKKIIEQQIFNEEEEKEYIELSHKVNQEKQIFVSWLETFYKQKCQRHDNGEEIKEFVKKFANLYQNEERDKNDKINLNQLMRNYRFNYICYYYIHWDTLDQIGHIISNKKTFFKKHYKAKYNVYKSQTPLHEICGIEQDDKYNLNKQCKFEFLANLNDNKAPIPQWMIPLKYFNRKYNDGILTDILPSGMDIFKEGENGEDDTDKMNKKSMSKCISTKYVNYRPWIMTSKDKVIDDTLKTNPNSKDINVVLDDAVMSLLIDIDGDNKWRKSFMIPFTLKTNINCNDNNILFMDKPCLDQEWKRRYCNYSYFKRVFRSYLASNFMKDNINKHEQYLYQQQQAQNGQNKNNNNNSQNIFKQMLSKQNEWNELMMNYSKNPHFVYSMWRLNTLHCLIRTQIYGQLTYYNNNNNNNNNKMCGKLKSNCYATLKLDYLNPHKQAFISHHNMKSEIEKDGNMNKLKSLRDTESALYGVERLTDSERMTLFIQTQLRSNNKLIIGRMHIPSRKLISCNIIDHHTLLNDESEHIYLETQYNNALYLIDTLCQYLLKQCKSMVNKQHLLAYDRSTDKLSIFCEPETMDTDNNDNDNDEDKDDNEEKTEITDLFDFHGYIDEHCGHLNDTEIEYIPPYSITYRGVMKSCHIPDISPPTNADLPRPCQMFLFHGFCPKYHENLQQKQHNNNNNNNNMHNNNNNGMVTMSVSDDKERCDFPHYRTHILSHCWEYALYGGHCERGIKCEWPHLRQQELINKGYEMFHVRQLINYCQDYYKNGRCKNSQSGGKCHCVHFNEQQLMIEFHTKYKNKQMRRGQLLARARILEKNLQRAQNQKFPGQRGGKKKRRSKNKYKKNNNIANKT